MIKYDKEPIMRSDLFFNYYFTFQTVPNGYGGYHPVNLTLNHDQKGIKREITDDRGFFIDFPGVVHGEWEREMTLPLMKQIRFVYRVGKPSKEEWLLNFYWMLQPDGRYWMDEDGYGMENDEEIILVAGMDKSGVFVTPFYSDKEWEKMFN